jgi:hypothetical protein
MITRHHPFIDLDSPQPDFDRDTTKWKEGRQVAALLRHFDFENCEAWRALTHQFSSGVRHKELSSVALVISHCFHVPAITRDARRSYPVLIKWFNDHWGKIQPIMPLIALHDEDDEIIDHKREAEAKSPHRTKHGPGE